MRLQRANGGPLLIGEMILPRRETGRPNTPAQYAGTVALPRR